MNLPERVSSNSVLEKGQSLHWLQRLEENKPRAYANGRVYDRPAYDITGFVASDTEMLHVSGGPPFRPALLAGGGAAR